MNTDENKVADEAVERANALAEEGTGGGKPEGQKKRPELKGRLSVKSMNFGIPTNSGAQEHVHEKHGKESWRYKVLSFLHSKPVQITLMCLLGLDIILLFVELFLLAAFPHCSVIERDAISCCPTEEAGGERFLADAHGDAHGEGICQEGLEPSYEYDAGCDSHKWHAAHTAEEVIFILTIIILSTFVVEQNLTMIALRPCIYFRQVFYLLDYVIVTTSLALEVTFYALSEEAQQSLVGLLIVARVWKYVRIGHGIIEITSELSHEEYEALLAYTEELERLLEANGIAVPDTESIRKLKDNSTSILGEIGKEHRKHYHHFSSGASNGQPNASEGASTKEEQNTRENE